MMKFSNLDPKQYKKHAPLLADVAGSVGYLLTVDKHVANATCNTARAYGRGEADIWAVDAARNAATAASRRAYARGDEVSGFALLAASFAADRETYRAAPLCAWCAKKARDLASGPGGSDQKERNRQMLTDWISEQNKEG